jgi:hypothetical protein
MTTGTPEENILIQSGFNRRVTPSPAMGATYSEPLRWMCYILKKTTGCAETSNDLIRLASLAPYLESDESLWAAGSAFK